MGSGQGWVPGVFWANRLVHLHRHVTLPQKQPQKDLPAAWGSMISYQFQRHGRTSYSCPV